MVALIFSFAVESVVLLVSATSEDLFQRHFVAIQSVYFVFNLLALAAVLMLFYKIVRATSEAYRTHLSLRSNRVRSVVKLQSACVCVYLCESVCVCVGVRTSWY